MGALSKDGLAKAYTVLYIEDNIDNVHLVEKILGRRESIEMLAASDADSGIELAVTRQPDLILLDINLGGKDGYAVLADLQKNERTRCIPVVGLSANAMPDDIEKALAGGFKEYITKPIDISQFLAKIDELLELHS